MDEVQLEARAVKLLAALREWVFAKRKNLERYNDVYHEADEGKRYQGALEIVVMGLGLAPEDAAILMGLMKTSWNMQGELIGKVVSAGPLPVSSSPCGRSRPKKK